MIKVKYPKEINLILCLCCLFIVSSCENDDDSSSDSFFNNALESATVEQILGRWAIFGLEFEGESSDVPESFPECGRDFFHFVNNGEYREYLFDDNFECTPISNTLNWTLTNGVITLSNQSESEQLVITSLNSDTLEFKFRLDTDADGSLEIFKATCLRYDPPIEIDSYSYTFQWQNTIEYQDRISLSWEKYQGFNEFDKYEIYRYSEACNSSTLELVATITDVNQSSFVDEDPPVLDEICYVFKIYTDKGLLGESESVSVDPSFISVPIVNMSIPELLNDNVNLSWEQYQGYYFSHYEVEVRNYSSGSGFGYFEDIIAEIDNISSLNFTTTIPFVNNPVFVINVYNIFGTKSQSTIQGQNKHSTSFTRDEILPVDKINYLTFSPTQPLIYFTDFSDIYKFNYQTNSLENAVNLNSSSVVFLKTFQSSFGTEVIVNSGSTLKVYDEDLNFKYNLSLSDPGIQPKHLILTENGYWLITDREELYSFSRSEADLNLISSNALYNQFFSSSNINVMDIGQNRILVGNTTQSQGLAIDIDSNGFLSSQANSVSANLTSQGKNNALYSSQQNYILNTEDNTQYSTTDYSLIRTFNQDYFITGLALQGSKILGTRNQPETSNNSFHEKKVVLLDHPSLNEQTIDTQGYPLYLHESYNGDIISVSKAFPGKLSDNSPERDMFIEKVNN